MGQMFLLWHLPEDWPRQAQTPALPLPLGIPVKGQFRENVFFLVGVWCTWTFVSQPGIECAPAVVEEQRPNHWTTRAFPGSGSSQRAG